MNVTFRAQGADPVTIACSAGENLLEVARRGGLALDAPCGGSGACGKCRVKLLSGSLEGGTDRHITPEELAEGWRLSCQCRVTGDCQVFLPETELFRGPEGRWETLAEAFSQLEMPPDGRGVALALDVGTTTVWGVLADRSQGTILSGATAANGQIPYGADVISRILESNKPAGRQRLQKAVGEKTLAPLVEKLCRLSGVSPEEISRVTVAANTTMNHLLVGEDADPIRRENYDPEAFNQKTFSPADAGLPGKGKLIFAPNVGAYVGGDIAAGVLASGMWKEEGMTLFVDLGTNGEIVLGNRELLLSCACSAGPAFEGGQISCGMRAAAGAVEAVKICRETGEPVCSVIGGGMPAGICGSGLIDLIAQLFSAGLLNGKGRFCKEHSRIIRDADGVSGYVLARAEESRTGRALVVDEVDIDNFIRAKGAIYAGIDTLLKFADIPPEALDRVLVAGGIGSGINLESAVTIGMLPNVERSRYRYIGNAALTGAYAMAVSQRAEETCRQVAGNMTYVDLSGCPGYMDAFVAACFLPHTDRSLFSKNKTDAL